MGGWIGGSMDMGWCGVAVQRGREGCRVESAVSLALLFRIDTSGSTSIML